MTKTLDRRLVLFLALLYMLSFLDRPSKPSAPTDYSIPTLTHSLASDIGNAIIAGLSEDLDLSSAQYEWHLTSFYCTYTAFQWMTLLYNIILAHIYISLCVASESHRIFAGSNLLLPNHGHSARTAWCWGSGLLPRDTLLLSFFFKRDELAYRTGVFISAALLATSFPGSLAWLITEIGDGVPVATWRLLFPVEGFPSITVSAMAWFGISDTPDTVRSLNLPEKGIARRRLEGETGP